MEYYPVIKDLVLFACIPGLVFIIKLWMDQVRMQERQKALDDKIYHLSNNYKQTIDHLNRGIEEVKSDIKELLKLYGNKSP